MSGVFQKAFLYAVNSKLLSIFEGSNELTIENLPEELPQFFNSKNISLTTAQEPPSILSSTIPVIIYGRHSSILDMLFVAAATGLRKNYKIVMLRIISLIFPGLKKDAIEVSSLTVARGSWLTNFRMKFGPMIENIPNDEALRLNKAVVPKTVASLAAGQNIILFPDAGEVQKPWRMGIGLILKIFADTYPKRDIALLPVFIDGYKKGDSLKQSIYMILGKPPKKIAQVTFGQVQLLSDLKKKELVTGETKPAAKTLVEFLEKQYRHEWYTKFHGREN